MTNPYESPLNVSLGPTGSLETTPEGWLQYHTFRTQEDWAALFQYFASRGPHASLYGARRLILPLLFVVPGTVWSVITQSVLVFVLTLSVAVLFWMRYPAMIQSTMRRNAYKMINTGRNLTLLGDQWITLTPKELRVRTEYSWSGIDWQAIEKIDVTTDHMFFFISMNSAIPVRLRDFPDEQGRQQFITRAYECYQAARGMAK